MPLGAAWGTLGSPMQPIIVIPTYNEADNLPALAAELWAQEIPDLRLLVVDDASPDGTGDVAEELAERRPGEIIVFFDPSYGRVPIYLPVAGQDTRLIVHRATGKVENDGTWYIQTWGDRNNGPDSWHGPDTFDGKISENLVVGKVIASAPWIGHIPLFMHEHYLIVTSIIVILFVVLIVADFIFPRKKSEEEQEKPSTDI